MSHYFKREVYCQYREQNEVQIGFLSSKILYFTLFHFPICRFNSFFITLSLHILPKYDKKCDETFFKIDESTACIKFYTEQL